MTLAEYITHHLQSRFAYGEQDCAMFAAGWVQLKTGVDPLATLPRWEDKRQALEVMRQVGGIERWMDENFVPIHPHIALDGDLALFKGSVCVFSGAHIVGPGEAGLRFIGRMAAELAWTIRTE